MRVSKEYKELRRRVSFHCQETVTAAGQPAQGLLNARQGELGLFGRAAIRKYILRRHTLSFPRFGSTGTTRSTPSRPSMQHARLHLLRRLAVHRRRFARRSQRLSRRRIQQPPNGHPPSALGKRIAPARCFSGL